MTDEDAFLAEIQEKPEDDLLRLIFADWLEEHDEPAKAEFLRMDVQYRRAKERMDALTPQLDAAWLDAVHRRRGLLMIGYPPTHKLHVIKLIRELTGLGLAESKALSESLPAVLLPEVSMEAFRAIKPQFDAVHAEVRMMPPLRPKP